MTKPRAPVLVTMQVQPPADYRDDRYLADLIEEHPDGTFTMTLESADSDYRTAEEAALASCRTRGVSGCAVVAVEFVGREG